MSKHFFQNATLRLLLLKSYRAYARSMFWRRGPKVFINSIPKAGTHLATAIIEEVPGLMQSRLHIEMWDIHEGPETLAPMDAFRPDIKKFKKLLATVRPGQIATAHLPWHPALYDAVEASGFRTIFITRQPEDVARSTLYYIKGLRRHFMHRRLMENYHSDEERLLAVREGIPARFEGDPSLEGTYDLRSRFMGWTRPGGANSSLVLEFEDLVGSNGGGSQSARRSAILSILGYLNMPNPDVLADEIDASSLNKKSFTFRSGKIGSSA